jgi:uncharacterized repeat protein (TIGR03803 family)
VHRISRLLIISSSLLSVLTTAVALPAQTFTTLFTFDVTNGANPDAGLVQATDGNLYGTAFGGGPNGYGTIFRITPDGSLTTIYSFCETCTDNYPESALVQAANGELYGSTAGSVEHPHTFGTVFRVTLSGTLKGLDAFSCSLSACSNGAYPTGLIQATNGDFYGETSGWRGYSYGTIFKITRTGALTTLYAFCADGGCPHAARPSGGLIQATDGNLYGTTQDGGASGRGSVFRITPGGKLATLYSFCAQSGCADGETPAAALVQATDGNLYGTTELGGANALGTVFKITTVGTLTTLYSFCSQTDCADGELPDAALVQATDGNLYGTTASASIPCSAGSSCGTVFEITLDGTLTTLYSFCSQSGCSDGENPISPLVQDTDGALYGTTDAGGITTGCPAGGCGTIFRLSMGLGPFVETLPRSGNIGAAVKILGTNLTGATRVTFNGTAAAFAVVAPSLITTAVPAGATTGVVQVMTPGGTLSSNIPFQVSQ